MPIHAFHRCFLFAVPASRTNSRYEVAKLPLASKGESSIGTLWVDVLFRVASIMGACNELGSYGQLFGEYETVPEFPGSELLQAIS
jgi:hypothetical protein